ncbi:hypothetical protein ASE66_25590 [Bosea sp. Root483D1]|uniref:hypothetical protein n=1 Tax=Bosea sp. Root483D1 TaxID=1736544 RepID=UPI00070A5769|nr:hypothetical protein [Bosea sp. Root483D1]KRE22566.1 hypothetical protein ASE66_25590 [Bosea sp. Root483D1]
MTQEQKIIDKFSEAMIRVRYVFIQEDGELVGFSDYDLQYFGWNVPVKGDKLLKLHDTQLYDPAVVVDRIIVDEAGAGFYWLLVLRMEEETAYMGAMANHMLLVTDMQEAMAAGDPDKDVLARMQQLTGRPSGRMRIQPKTRDPDPDGDWDEEDDT